MTSVLKNQWSCLWCWNTKQFFLSLSPALLSIESIISKQQLITNAVLSTSLCSLIPITYVISYANHCYIDHLCYSIHQYRYPLFCPWKLLRFHTSCFSIAIYQNYYHYCVIIIWLIGSRDLTMSPFQHWINEYAPVSAGWSVQVCRSAHRTKEWKKCRFIFVRADSVLERSRQTKLNMWIWRASASWSVFIFLPNQQSVVLCDRSELKPGWNNPPTATERLPAPAAQHPLLGLWPPFSGPEGDGGWGIWTRLDSRCTLF